MKNLLENRVARGEKCFFSSPPTWPPWHHVQGIVGGAASSTLHILMSSISIFSSSCLAVVYLLKYIHFLFAYLPQYTSICPKKFCISIVFNFPWYNKFSKEIQTKDMQNRGGSWESRVHKKCVIREVHVPLNWLEDIRTASIGHSVKSGDMR